MKSKYDVESFWYGRFAKFVSQAMVKKMSQSISKPLLQYFHPDQDIAAPRTKVSTNICVQCQKNLMCNIPGQTFSFLLVCISPFDKNHSYNIFSSVFIWYYLLEREMKCENAILSMPQKVFCKKEHTHTLSFLIFVQEWASERNINIWIFFEKLFHMVL